MKFDYMGTKICLLLKLWEISKNNGPIHQHWSVFMNNNKGYILKDFIFQTFVKEGYIK